MERGGRGRRKTIKSEEKGKKRKKRKENKWPIVSTKKKKKTQLLLVFFGIKNSESTGSFCNKNFWSLALVSLNTIFDCFDGHFWCGLNLDCFVAVPNQNVVAFDPKDVSSAARSGFYIKKSK
jgi:hypothetical protein